MSEGTGRIRKYKEVAAGTLLTAIILCCYASMLSVPVISDETVTMANAAWTTGYDWSYMIAALGGYYYRYAQALMTVPLFAFLKDPEMIYRLSMILQAVIQASIVPVVYVICRRHLHVESARISVLLGMSVGLVPSMALYTFYYRGDYLLGVLPWYALLTFLETMEAAEAGKRMRRIGNTVLTVFFGVLAYMAHTRGIVLILALLMSAILVRVVLKRKSLHGPVLLIALAIFLLADSLTGQVLKEALYSVSGLNANAIESTDVGFYFDIFSYSAIKDLAMLCLSWLSTLISSTQGLVLVGGIAGLAVLGNIAMKKRAGVTDAEAAVLFLSLLVFLGYYAIGALYFRGAYISLATNVQKTRVDRLLYDRYAICGAGMLVFWALYVLCEKRDWLKKRGRLVCVCAAAAVTVLFLWKIMPVALKYKGYVYNTIVLNTFRAAKNPAGIIQGEYYGKAALMAAVLLGIALMLAVLAVSSFRRRWMPYVVLSFVLLSDLALIHVNYIKIRKAANDYVLEATDAVVMFLEGIEGAVAEEYPYILKGGLSGVKIQFYQSQLMDFRMFGKKQEEQLDLDNYFIISAHDDIDLTWYEDDYYLFDAFDYENAQYDVVYVKGEALKEKLESLGYGMTRLRTDEEIRER